MNTSDFISTLSKDNKQIESRTPIDNKSKTSLSYIAKIDGKQYFMKRLRPEYIKEQRFHNIFQKEYEKGTTVNHPNIVRYEQFHDTDDDCYILMENICGETLDTFLINNPGYFSSRSNLDKFFNQLCSGLNCLHNNHIVHSDLKPQNIMITQINNDVKILDLGFCFTDSYSGTAGMTRAYAAPEQISNYKLDETTDIYAIGKIIEYINKNVSHDIPNVYTKIMLRCLKERKEERYQNTTEITKLINKRKHTTRRIIVSCITCVILFLAFKTLTYNEHFIAWWDSFEIIPRNIDYDFEYHHLYYRILPDEKNCVEIVGASSVPNVYIHETINENGKTYKVTHIADSAFLQRKHIKSVYIPDGLTTIGKDAFRGCKSLLIINIPNSVKTIGVNAFYACNNVSNLKLSSSLTEIPASAFCGMKILKIEIPEGVTTIKLDAFGNCGKLKHVKLPNSLVTLERGVFYNGASIEQILIPKNVKNIGEYLFFGCTNLKNIFNMAVEPQSIPPIHKNPSQITLHVPAESVEKYRNADYWKEMKIVPILD